MIRKALIVLGVILLLAQFIQPTHEFPVSDPSLDLLEMYKPSIEVASLVKNACYDCHSNETKYPFYSLITPLNFWLKSHVENGRRELNFSTWKSYEHDKMKHKLEESADKTERKEMPLLSYMIMHRDAWLSEEERSLLVEWFRDPAKR